MNASEKGFTYSIGPDTPAVEEQLRTK